MSAKIIKTALIMNSRGLNQWQVGWSAASVQAEGNVFLHANKRSNQREPRNRQQIQDFLFIWYICFLISFHIWTVDIGCVIIECGVIF